MKWNNFDIIKSRAIFITMWGNFFYKAEQILQSRAITSKQCRTEEKSENRGRDLDFGNLLLDSSLICLATENLLVGIPENLKFCQNQKKEEITPQLVSLRNNDIKMFLVLFFLNSQNISRKLTITEGDYVTFWVLLYLNRSRQWLFVLNTPGIQKYFY